MDSNFINQNNINNLNNMIKNGDISKLMANIPPDVLNNLSVIVNDSKNNINNDLNQNNRNNNNNFNQNYYKNNAYNSNNNSSNSLNNLNKNNFDFNNIDIASVMKMKDILEKINISNGQRTNLLNSLRPYLREEKKEKLDQYSNIMNIAKIADLLKSDSKNNNK